MGSSITVPKMMACAALACFPAAAARPTWNVTIMYQKTEQDNFKPQAETWQREFQNVTNGVITIMEAERAHRDVRGWIRQVQNDSVFIYLGHGSNDGTTPFPVIGDLIKGREIVNALKSTRSTIIFNCCNMRRSQGPLANVDPGNAVVMFAQPNSQVEMSTGEGMTLFLQAFKNALKRQGDHQLAAIRADDRVLTEWKERFNIYVTDKDEELEIAAMDDDDAFQATINKSMVISGATSPVEELIPFRSLTDGS